MMTTEKIQQATRDTRKIIERAWGGNEIKPFTQRLPDTAVHAGEYRPRERAAHMLYMCDMIMDDFAMSNREKAMRWLGFVQGALWAGNEVTIDDLKKLNMPDDEEPHARR